MNIAFICSSIEAGKDGVGDYSRLLALELSRLGYNISVIALNDKYVSETTEGVISEQNKSLKFLRIPQKISVNQRSYLFSNWINSENPHLISIQYSGFGFHKYGLPWYIIRDFRKATSKCIVHIMFHELWCGMSSKASIKEKILGFSQAFFIKTMVLALKPKSVFTSILPYVNSLKSVGVLAKTTPIFSTIDLNDFGNDQDWDLIKRQSDLYPLIYNPSHWLIIGFFGTIYPCSGLKKLVQVCSESAFKSNKKFGLIFFGNNRGINTDTLLNGIFTDHVWHLGSMTVPMINRVIKLVNLGIVTSPADGIDKSTTAKAWLERVVPVLISENDISYNKALMEPMGIYQALSTTDVFDAIESTSTFNSSSSLHNTVIAYENLFKINVQ